jgi:hypothetical protein
MKRSNFDESMASLSSKRTKSENQSSNEVVIGNLFNFGDEMSVHNSIQRLNLDNLDNSFNNFNDLNDSTVQLVEEALLKNYESWGNLNSEEKLRNMNILLGKLHSQRIERLNQKRVTLTEHSVNSSSVGNETYDSMDVVDSDDY